MRLTNDIREAIRNKAVDAAFQKEKAALAKQGFKLAELCYKSLFLASVRKAAAAAPKGWVTESATFLLNVNGEQIRLTTESPVHVPTSHYYHHSYVLKNADLGAEVRAHAREIEDMSTRRKAAERALTALLDSVSTLKKLFEIWPEGRAFYKDVAPTVVNLPAVHVGEVNKLLNLKTAA